MKLAVFDTHTYDREALAAANARYAHDLTFFEPRLTRQTASMATGYPAVCSVVNDRVEAGRRVSRCPRAGVLASCGCGAHGWPHPGAEPEDPPGLQPSTGRQLLGG